MRKLISTILSVVMVFSMLTVLPAFATESNITDYTDTAATVFKTFLTDNENKFDANYFFLAKMPSLEHTETFGLEISTDSETELTLALGLVDSANNVCKAISTLEEGEDVNPLETPVLDKISVSAENSVNVYVNWRYTSVAGNYLGIAVQNAEKINGDFEISVTPVSATPNNAFNEETQTFSCSISYGEVIGDAISQSFTGPITFDDSSLEKIGVVLTSLNFGTSVNYDDVVAALADITTDDAKKELNNTITDEQISALAKIIANGNSGKAITTNSGVVTIPNIALAVAPAIEGTVYAVEAAKVEATEVAPSGMNEVVAYDIKIKADDTEVQKPIVAQKVMVDLPNGWDTTAVKVQHNTDGWTDATVENGKIVFTTDSFSTFTFAGVNAVATEDNRAEQVKFEIIQDETNPNKFSLVITPMQKENNDTQIIKFAAAVMKYDFRKGSIADDEVMNNFTYKLTEVDGVSIKEIDHTGASDSIGGFSFIATATDGENLLTAGVGESIKVADLEITGKGKINVATDSFEAEDIIYFETADDNEVSKISVYATNSNPYVIEIPEITYDLTINVDFGLNRIETTDADYLGMTVTLKGSITKEEIVLNIGNEIAVTLDEANQRASATGKVNLPANESYTFAIEGLGYRTYRGSVYLDENKTINLWNNAKTSGSVNVVADDDSTAKKVTFLVGDIYMDGIVDIYDLSAATSYYGAESIDKANTNVYACDLNRDGKITIADIAYVQVSYGN